MGNNIDEIDPVHNILYKYGREAYQLNNCDLAIARLDSFIIVEKMQNNPNIDLIEKAQLAIDWCNNREQDQNNRPNRTTSPIRVRGTQDLPNSRPHGRPTRMPIRRPNTP